MRFIIDLSPRILFSLSVFLLLGLTSATAEQESQYGSDCIQKEADSENISVIAGGPFYIDTGQQAMDPNQTGVSDPALTGETFSEPQKPLQLPEPPDSVLSASITFPPWDETSLSLGGSSSFAAAVTGGNPPLTYLWDFDGGAENSTSLNPGVIKFDDPGTFTVTFAVTDADGDQDSDTVTIKVAGSDLKPSAEITSPTEDVTITAGQSVHFAAEARGGNPPLSYEWDFQGGVEVYSGTFFPPNRIRFAEPGIYTVTFTAWDYDDDADSDSVRITVNPVDVDTKPVINMIYPESNLTIVQNQYVSFFSSVHGGNPPFEYEWNFDGAAEGYFEDCSFANPPRPIRFDQAGIYNVIFTVTDADGDTDRILRVITVEPAVRPEKPKPVSIDLSPVDPVHATTLQVEPFVHPADGSIHAATRWQISEEDEFFALTLDIASETWLTQIPMSVLLLKPETGYFWRAKFFDDDGNESEWSNTAAFFTGVRDDDANGNGISDTLEVNESVDLDRDGRPDRDQEEMTCIRTAGGETIAGLKISSHVGSLAALHSVDPASVSQKDVPPTMPIGFIAFRADTVIPGQIVEIIFYLPEPLPDDMGWYEFNLVDGWSDYSDHAVFKEDGRSITLHIQDGGTGDADGTANGTIVHSSGPGRPLLEPPGGNPDPESGSAGGSGCFITIISP
ncbi:MAG: PKD domain-containing protein [Thermodesulfobacteriota bacterium]